MGDRPAEIRLERERRRWGTSSHLLRNPRVRVGRADNHRNVSVIFIEVDVLEMREGRKVTTMRRDVSLAGQQSPNKCSLDFSAKASVDRFHRKRRKRPSIC